MDEFHRIKAFTILLAVIDYPGFTLFNQDHVQFSSNNLLREAPLIVSFFRGHW